MPNEINPYRMIGERKRDNGALFATASYSIISIRHNKAITHELIMSETIRPYFGLNLLDILIWINKIKITITNINI